MEIGRIKTIVKIEIKKQMILILETIPCTFRTIAPNFFIFL